MKQRSSQERDKVLRDRLELIRQRHRKLILEPRKKLTSTMDPDLFYDEEDFDSYEYLDMDFRQDQESELF